MRNHPPPTGLLQTLPRLFSRCRVFAVSRSFVPARSGVCSLSVCLPLSLCICLSLFLALAMYVSSLLLSLSPSVLIEDAPIDGRFAEFGEDPKRLWETLHDPEGTIKRAVNDTQV